jgi:hypothetical protein
VGISDHALRVRGGKDRVVGILFGVQKGLKLEVFSTFEALVRFTPTGPSLDLDFIQKQIKLSECAERRRCRVCAPWTCRRPCTRSHPTSAASTVFPAYELLGLYVIKSGSLDGVDRELLSQASVLTASPLLLHVDLGAMRGGAVLKELPIHVCVSAGQTMRAAEGDAAMGGGEEGCGPPPGWAYLPFKIEASETERIALDHISTTSALTGGGGGGHEATPLEVALAAHPVLAGQRAVSSALDSLAARVDSLLAFTRAAAASSVPPSPAVSAALRDVASLLARLPVQLPAGAGAAGRAAGARALTRDAADGALVQLAGALTEGVGALAVVAEKGALYREGDGDGGRASSMALAGTWASREGRRGRGRH